MKRFAAVTTLSLALGLSSLSYASDFMKLYTRPSAENGISTEIKAGSVEKDAMSFYTSPKKVVSITSSQATGRQAEEELFSVFGVQVSSR